MNLLKTWRVIKYIGEVAVYCIFLSAAFWIYYQQVKGNPYSMPVAITESMYPLFQPGDYLLSHHNIDNLKIGDIICFQLDNIKYPIVHRIVEIFHNTQKKPCYLTKGDANKNTDVIFYPEGQKCVVAEDIYSKVYENFRIPYLGYVSVYFDKIPYFKHSVLVLVVFVFFVKGTQRFIRYPPLIRKFVSKF